MKTVGLGFVSNQIGKVTIDTKYDGLIRKSIRVLNACKVIASLWRNGGYQTSSMRVSSDGARPSEMWGNINDNRAGSITPN